MMGATCGTGRSGPGWRTIDAMLPRDHILRRVDRLLDTGELRAALTTHYSPRGHPSINPELLIRMALIGRIYAITSERRLCEELRYNLAYRWFCRLAPNAAVPHHSTSSKNRHGRFRDAGVFRLLFESTVRRCIAAGLVAGKDAAINASFVAADASWQCKMRPTDLSDAGCPALLARPVREWLADQALAPVNDVGPRRGTPAELSRTDPAAAGAMPHIPVLERSEQTKGKFPREAFVFERERNRYICPDGKALVHRGFDQRIGVHTYAARPVDCQACVYRRRCTSGKHRSVTRMEDEDTRDLVRAEMRTGLYKRSMRLRRGVERLFADAKARRGLARLHLRGLRGAEEEFQLAAAVSNLLLLARPVERAPRPDRARAAPRRISGMERISRGGFEPSYYVACR